MNSSAMNDIGTLPNWLNHAHSWVSSMNSLLHIAEQHKPLALYVGAAIVLLNGAHAVRALLRTRSGSVKGGAHANAL